MDIDKVAFTGSTEVGKLIMRAAADSNLKRVTLELGGKSPNIVLRTPTWTRQSKVRISPCSLTKGSAAAPAPRVFVEEKAYDQFVERSAARAKRRTVGNPMDATTEQGPQVDNEQFTKVLSFIESGKQEGAKLVAGGDRVGERGYFVAPTVFQM